MYRFAYVKPNYDFFYIAGGLSLAKGMTDRKEMANLQIKPSISGMITFKNAYIMHKCFFDFQKCPWISTEINNRVVVIFIYKCPHAKVGYKEETMVILKNKKYKARVSSNSHNLHHYFKGCTDVS